MSQTSPPSLLPLLAAVVASVCGTVVTSALGASPSLRLAGAAIGAGLPPLVASAGPYARLRVATGALVAAGALVVTYGGFTLSDYATHQEVNTFPVADVLEASPDVDATSGAADHTDQSRAEQSTGSDNAEIHRCDGDLCISVTPVEITCAAVDCSTEVTVRSSGTRALDVTGVELDDGAEGGYDLTGACADFHPALEGGQTCTLTVTGIADPPVSGRLVIHQNLSGDATYVPIVGDPGNVQPTGFDLSLSAQPVCTVTPAGGPSGEDLLRIELAVETTGAERDGSVAYIASGGSTAATEGLADYGPAPYALTAEIEISPYGYEQPLAATVTVDPYDDLGETDEANNTRQVSVELPVRPDDAAEVSCSID